MTTLCVTAGGTNTEIQVSLGLHLVDNLQGPENDQPSADLKVRNRDATIDRKAVKTWERGRDLRTALAE